MSEPTSDQKPFTAEEAFQYVWEIARNMDKNMDKYLSVPCADYEHDKTILRCFVYHHQSESLQTVSKPFGELAVRLVRTLPIGTERTTALKKLLEAKDAAVDAVIETQKSRVGTKQVR